jgi:hypothetical protein
VKGVDGYVDQRLVRLTIAEVYSDNLGGLQAQRSGPAKHVGKQACRRGVACWNFVVGLDW